MGVELYIPEPALYERAEQGIRRALDELAAAWAKAKAAGKALRCFGAAVVLQAPAEAELRTRYTSAEQEALKSFHIQLTPYASRPLDEVFRMAVTRGFTFEGKGSGVVGLQDCVILLSVFDHLRANPTSAALVSKDEVFSRIPALAPTGIELRLISGLTALNEVLDKAHHAAFSAEFKQWFTEETERITQLLTTHREKIQNFLELNIDPSEVEKVFSGSILSTQPPTIEHFGIIRPELEGAVGEPLRFSCDVSVSYTAIVEQRFSSLAALLGQQPPLEPSPPVQVTEHRTVTVELAAQISPDYTNLTLQTARIRS